MLRDIVHPLCVSVVSIYTQRDANKIVSTYFCQMYTHSSSVIICEKQDKLENRVFLFSLFFFIILPLAVLKVLLTFLQLFSFLLNAARTRVRNATVEM